MNTMTANLEPLTKPKSKHHWLRWLVGGERPNENPKLAPINVGDWWRTIETEINPFRDPRITIKVVALKEGWVRYEPKSEPGTYLETPERRFRNMFEPLQASNDRTEPRLPEAGLDKPKDKQ